MAQMKFENGAWYLSDNWSIEDVRSVLDCDDREVALGLTDDECVRVLELVVDAFDANIGVNWGVIGAALDVVLSEKPRETT